MLNPAQHGKLPATSIGQEQMLYQKFPPASLNVLAQPQNFPKCENNASLNATNKTAVYVNKMSLKH
jgi:hypothetical protein